MQHFYREESKELFGKKVGGRKEFSKGGEGGKNLLSGKRKKGEAQLTKGRRANAVSNDNGSTENGKGDCFKILLERLRGHDLGTATDGQKQAIQKEKQEIKEKISREILPNKGGVNTDREEGQRGGRGNNILVRMQKGKESIQGTPIYTV